MMLNLEISADNMLLAKIMLKANTMLSADII
jgi:hypothetical protein